MFTFAMPQSESVVETNLSASRTSSVKIEEVRGLRRLADDCACLFRSGDPDVGYDFAGDRR
jgi:hypothetical protein